MNTRQIEVEAILPHAPRNRVADAHHGCDDGALASHEDGRVRAGRRHEVHLQDDAGRRAWDGVIHCEVREVVPNERLVYSWKGGDESIVEGYGAVMDTVVAFTIVQGGERHAPSSGAFGLSRAAAQCARV